jgi:hypothetical protein
MPEGNINTEVVEHLSEHGGGHEHRPENEGRLRVEVIEILEAVLLSLVAIATAWSGYQSAKWDGHSANHYATASKLRVESEQYNLQSGQYLLYNTNVFDSWVQATTLGEKKLAAIMHRRFTPNYRVAFDAWWKLHPFTNPKAPAGPRFMPQYKDPLAAQGQTLSDQSTAAFDEGATDRETGEKYVRVTVILAMVLFLIALGQRFKIKQVRVGVLVGAGVFLAYAAILVTGLPRA